MILFGEFRNCLNKISNEITRSPADHVVIHSLDLHCQTHDWIGQFDSDIQLLARVVAEFDFGRPDQITPTVEMTMQRCFNSRCRPIRRRWRARSVRSGTRNFRDINKYLLSTMTTLQAPPSFALVGKRGVRFRLRV